MRATFTLIMLVATCLSSKAQSSIRLDTIYATTNKTVTLIFPENIIIYDIGSEDFGGMKSTNLLLVKAVSENVPATSILIQYGNNVYHGTIAYHPNPKITFVDFRNTQIPTLINETRATKQDSVKNLDSDVAAKRLNVLMSDPKTYFKTLAVPNEKMVLTISNMMTDESTIYIKMLFINKSKINYQIDFVEFIYRDPIAEKSLKGGFDRKNAYPITSNKVELIEAKQERYLGFAIPRYNLSKRGFLDIVIREKTGSRIMELSVPFTDILTLPSVVKK